MKKFVLAAAAAALLVTAAIPNKAHAVGLAPVVASSAAVSSGAWFAGGFIGFVALLDGYDFYRRSACTGDFLNLGGPGFDSPITAQSNVLVNPHCAPKKHHRRKHAKH